MTITTSIPIPAGTTVTGDWDTDGGHRYRIVQGRERDRDGFKVVATAVQLDDGQIDGGDVIEAPKLLVFARDLLTVEQARALAATLIDVAAEVDGWFTPATKPITRSGE